MARELVPGDLIELHLGDVVPADAILLPGAPVQADQSALTVCGGCEPRPLVQAGAAIASAEVASLWGARGDPSALFLRGVLAP